MSFLSNTLPSHSLQAQLHRKIKVIPGMTRRLQGLVMQEFRETVIEPNPKAVRFAEAIVAQPFDNEFGHCIACGHGGNLEEDHADTCAYIEAMEFLGRDIAWVKPVPPKYKTKKVVACYIKVGMHVVVDDCACEITGISASPHAHPAHYQVDVMTETGIPEVFHFTHLQEVYILENE